VARKFTCDICGKPTEKIEAKLFAVPSRNHRMHYSHHADVGECCWNRLLDLFHWSERVTRKVPAKPKVRKKEVA